MIKFLVQRPVGVVMSFFVLTILGWIAAIKIPNSLLPGVDIPKIEIRIKNAGNSPESFDRTVVSRFRGNLSQTTGLAEIGSKTDAANAVVELTFDYGTSMDEVFYEVNERVDEVLASITLPLDRPRVLKTKVSELPSLYLAVEWKASSLRSQLELSEIAENVVRRQLEEQPEISFVDASGLARAHFEMTPNADQLTALGLTPEHLLEVLRQHNLTLGSITVTDGHLTYALNLEASINLVDDIVRITFPVQGRHVTVGEVATIRAVSETVAPYFHGEQPGISMALIKSARFREKNFISAVNAVTNDLQERYPDLRISTTKSNGHLLTSLLADLFTSLLWGLVFAVGVTLLFLRSLRNAMLILLAVTVSLLIDFLLFYAIGITINIVSISGLILGIGLMIDNMIIVLDNIEQNIMSEGSVNAGAVAGVTELITSFISSTLTTCGVFVPLVFLSGLAGILFYDQAIAVTAALFSSFIVSMFLLPVLYPIFQRGRARTPPKPMLYALYAAGRSFCHRHPRALSGCLVLLLASGIVTGFLIGKEQLPQLDSTELVCRISWNQEYTEDDLIRHTKRALANVANDVESSEVYLHRPEFLSKTQRRQVDHNETLFYLRLKLPSDRPVLLRKMLDWTNFHYPNATVDFLPEESALNAILVRDEYNLKVISQSPTLGVAELYDKLRQYHPELRAVYGGTERTLHISFDERRLAIYGISRERLVQVIAEYTGGTTVMSLPHEADYIPVVLAAGSNSLSSLLAARISVGDKSYPLNSLIEVSISERKKTIEATGVGPCEILYINTDDASAMITEIRALFPGETLSFEGTFQYTRQLTQEILVILAITVALLYLILAIQFDSLKLPLIILAEIPIDLAFATTVLYLCGQTLNVMSFIGMVIMCGIVINDSILKIELIDQLRRSGVPLDEAITVSSKRRLNAILMTTLSTFLAVIPTLFQHDLASQLQSPLIIALISGLGFGTLVSLYFIPVLYKWLIK